MSRSTKATLNAPINPENENTKYTFEYSTTASGTPLVLGGTIVKEPGAAELEGYPEQTGTVALSGLEAGKTYYYRVVAKNAQDTAETKLAEGEVQSFTTVPTPATEAVTAPTATTATFNGHLTPLNPTVPTQYHFSYNLSTGGGACTGEHETGAVEAGTSATPGTEAKATTSVGGLQPHHEYTVCLVTSNASGSQEGSPVHFMTAPVPLEITGESVSGVTPSEATLEAKVNPNNRKTTYTFEYATNPALTGATVLTGAALEGFGPQTASVPTGAVLTVGETYYYRVVVKNEEISEVVDGTIQSFTPNGAPLVGAGEARSITDTSAAITGTVNPAGVETKYHVVYVDAAEYEPGAAGGRSPYSNGGSTLEASAGAGNTAVAVAPLEVSELQPGTTYDYAFVATNSVGTEIGPNATFTTVATLPILSGVSVSAVTQSAATISATLEPRGLITSWRLELGTTPGSLLFQSGAGSSDSPGAESIVVNAGSLSPGTTYYYKFIAINSDNPVNPETQQREPVETQEASFTTAPAPAASSSTQPPVPLLTIPSNPFPEEEKSTGKISTKQTAKCAKGKKRSHGKCVKVKSKKKSKGKKGKK